MGYQLLVIDEGTTSTRAMLFDPTGMPGRRAARAVPASFRSRAGSSMMPRRSGQPSLACARAMVEKAGGAERIAAIGITNQRETIVFWDRRRPARRWRRRSSGRTGGRRILREAQGRPATSRGCRRRPGCCSIPISARSRSPGRCEHWPQLREAGDDLAIGTVDSWLVFKLTGGLHVSDATNASRTALMDIQHGRLGRRAARPVRRAGARRCPRSSTAPAAMADEPSMFGAPIPICGMAGDQQAAAIGQACFAPGETKATYGTGAFVLTHTGDDAAGLATPAADHGRLAAGRRAPLCARRLGVRRRQPDPVAAGRARADRDRGRKRGAGALGRRHAAASIWCRRFAGLGAPHWRPGRARRRSPA